MSDIKTIPDFSPPICTSDHCRPAARKVCGIGRGAPMTDRPIPFSPLMVRAILREIEQPGTGKTQTRRHLTGACDDPPAFIADGVVTALDANDRSYRWPRTHGVGDRLWVKEAYRLGDHLDALSPSKCSPSYVWYEADAKVLVHGRETNDPIQDSPGRYRHARFMPRWASRLTLIVTDVRVERLGDISEEDAIAEGVVDMGRRDGAPYSHCIIPGMPEITMEHEPSTVFAHLWERINGPGSWEANPWVAVYGFRPFLANIDNMEAQDAA